jgi:hypothetical protein
MNDDAASLFRSRRMWHTEPGDRVLCGREWELFRLGIELIWEDIVEFDEPASTWITVFDNLSQGQQLAMLEQVGSAISDEAVEAPELTALNEGTVAAVFMTLEQAVDIEIDNERGNEDTEFRTSIRSSIREAYIECFGQPAPDEATIPELDCDDADEWKDLIEQLEERILWDLDYAQAHLHLDAPPEQSALHKSWFGIDQDYYTAIAPDPTEAELKEIRKSLKRLMRRKR